MRGVRGFLTAATIAVLAAALTACSSNTPQTKALSPPKVSPFPSPSPVGSHCPAAPGTEIIAADGITTVSGAFAITGYVETAECGPGVPDDVMYLNTGAHRAFVLPAGIRVILLYAAQPSPHIGTLTDLEVLLQDAFAKPPSNNASNGSMLWSHYFQLSLGNADQITGITSLYHP